MYTALRDSQARVVSPSGRTSPAVLLSVRRRTTSSAPAISSERNFIHLGNVVVAYYRKVKPELVGNQQLAR